MSTSAKSRDKHFVSSQNTLGSAMIAMAKGISLLLELQEDETTSMLLEFLGNAGKLMAGLHHQHSTMRRAFILSGVDEKYRELLKKSEITADLFGNELFKRLKHTKSLEKPANEIKRPLTTGSKIGRPSKVPEIQGPSKKLVLEQHQRKDDETQLSQSASQTLEVRKVAGRLKAFQENWEGITKSRFVLNCIKGYTIRFEAQPVQSSVPESPILQGSQSLEDVRGAIKNLLKLVDESSSKYLRFIFQGQCFEFVCLPFGLNVAPHVFTKILKPVVNQLRKRGFTSVIYLDDMLLIGSSKQACAENVKASVSLLESLGFIINYKKSILEPRRRVEFLGIIYDSKKMTLKLPEEKKQKMLTLLEQFKIDKDISLRQWSSFIGSINACCPAVEYGRLYTKEFERVRYLGLLRNNNDFEPKIRIPKSLKPDIDWWKKNIPKASSPIKFGNFKHEIFSDASTTGWGAFCEGKKARGFWTVEEQKWHINRLELKIILQPLHISIKWGAYNTQICTGLRKKSGDGANQGIFG
ncbi:PREDICTED: uncharacterized protein LOC105453949 [Wasmannia auropunctata]|uniref:uncharacterized protein LOC105453949 n=1 Tax=Wasmannia auropunctata TaxID=64793 RepID=UPI0005F04E26|nr:PREDICTED: uncharacterized protein LOC105453949 [Wasmannia auropunctata]